MRKDWFMPMKLAARLAAGEVTNREVAYLMLCNLVFGSVIFYGAFTWANPPWTLLSLVEFVTVIAITVVGFTNCFYAARGEDNAAFAMQFNCLSFGAWFWATAVTWAVYWAAVWLFQAGVFAAYRFDRIGLANNLARIGGSFEWLWTFIAAVAWQVIYFAKLRHGLARANGAA
jgi:hypothetical protein